MKLDATLMPLKESSQKKCLLQPNSFYLSRGIEGGPPEKYDIPYKEIKWIYIGKCAGEHETHHYGNLGRDILAHTHKCNNDPLYNVICLSYTSLYLRKINGDISDTMVHEYGHILQKGIGCEWSKNYNDNELQKIFHGYEWQKIMIDILQRPDIAFSAHYLY